MIYRSFQSEGGKVALAVAGPLQPLMGNGEVEVFFDPVAVGLAGEALESAISVSAPGLCLRAVVAILVSLASVARSRSSRLRARCGAVWG